MGGTPKPPAGEKSPGTSLLADDEIGSIVLQLGQG